MEEHNMYHAMLLTEFLARITGAESSPNYLAYIVCDHNNAYEGGDVPYQMVASAELAAEVVTERMSDALDAALNVLKMPELGYRRITTEKPEPLPEKRMIAQELQALGVGNCVEINNRLVSKIGTDKFRIDGNEYYFFEACAEIES